MSTEHGHHRLDASPGDRGRLERLIRFSLRHRWLVLAGATFLLMQGSLFLRERPGEKWFPWTAGSAQLNADEAPAESLRELFLVLARAFRRPVAYLAAGFAIVALTPTRCSRWWVPASS